MREIVCGKSRRPGRLFYCLISVLLVAKLSDASGPTMTTISDVVYRANGETASGTVVITWPTFTTRDNKAVAAGELSAVIGPSGLLTLGLAPNEGATPGGTYYKVVYKLSDGTTSTEYWVVPAASPTTIAAVRATVVPTQIAAQLASKQYVDSAVTGNSDAVVHKTGTESISGVKAFSDSPTAPNPTSPTAVANKDYVDIAVGSVTGSYVRTSGDTMTGQLSLAADPVAPNQAANRHYVDIQTSTLNAGLLSKLGRLNDTPITLAAVRYADQFAGLSIGAQIDAACADLSGANGTVVIPSTMAAGWSLAGIPSNCFIRDERGTGGSPQNNIFVRGTDFYSRITSLTDSSGLQIPSTMLCQLDAYRGGFNSGPHKTQWQCDRIEVEGRTLGETKAVEANVRKTSMGDAVGLFGAVNHSGGYGTGGDEVAVGVRGEADQGDGSVDGGYARGTVSAVNGNTITGAWNFGTNASLGDGRIFINTSRDVYSVGNITSVAGLPCVVTGDGTQTWATKYGSGAHTDLFLNITGNDSGTTKHVVPIVDVIDNNHLSLDYQLGEIGSTCFGSTMVKTGAYNIYHGGTVVSLVDPPSGSGPNPTGVILDSGGSNFQVGDSIQSPLAHNFHGVAFGGVVKQIVGQSGQGAGISVSNNGTIPFGAGARLIGNYVNGIGFDSGALSGHGVFFNEPVAGALIRQSDMSASVQAAIQVLNGSAAARTLQYDRTNDWWVLSGGQYFSATDARTSISSTPQANVLSFLGWNNAAWTGLSISPSQVPNAGVPMLDVGGGAFTRFRVEANRTVVNNASDLIGFSDNEVTQRWGVTGSTGAGRFDGGVTTGAIIGTNINATTGFQVSGSALNFSNLAGSVSSSQMPATQLLTEIAAPSNPAAGKAIFWNDSTTHRQGSKDSNGFTVSAPDYFDDSVFGWKDDFSVPTGTGFGEMNWSTQTFTAATFSRQTSGVPNIGVVRIATPAVLNQGGALQHTNGNVGFLPNMATTTKWKMEFIFKITSASTADHQLYVGFGPVNSGTATLTTFVGCRYKTTTTESDSAFHFVAGDGAWADSGTTSAVDNTAFHKFVMYSTVAGTIQFEMDGVSKGSVSTHIPAGNYAPIILLSNGAGTAVKSVDIDKVALEFTGLAR